MGLPRDILRENVALSEWAIFTCYRGSIAHGTFRPAKDPLSIDDKDVMALVVPPPEYFLGLKKFGSRGTKEIKRDEWDIVLYEIKKAIGLLAQGNPNVMQILWLEDRHYIQKSLSGEYLLSERDAFVGKHVYKPYVGYARAQFKKMTRGLETGEGYSGYMGTKRKALVDQFGFDTKNASHMIRLLRSGIEFLATGEMLVERPDAQELVAIKEGEWTLARVNSEAERLFDKIEDALIHSKLPEKPDRGRISHICQTIVLQAWTELHNVPTYNLPKKAQF